MMSRDAAILHIGVRLRNVSQWILHAAKRFLCAPIEDTPGITSKQSMGCPAWKVSARDRDFYLFHPHSCAQISSRVSLGRGSTFI